MKPSLEFHKSGKLVDDVADWLCERAIPDAKVAKAASLAHVLVVVPTAQAGRALRLALARRFPGRGLVPPRVVRPMQLVRGAGDDPSVATEPQARAAFLAFFKDGVGTCPAKRWPRLFAAKSSAPDADDLLSFFDQLEELWRILGAGGLTMQDVADDPRAAAVFEKNQTTGDEPERWRDLAGLEADFFEFLHGHGLRHEAERIREARAAAPALDPEVREIVLAALCDPVPVLYDVLANTDRPVTAFVHADEADRGKFYEWGRPRIEAWTGPNRPVFPLPDRDPGKPARDLVLVRAPTDAALANEIAGSFPEADGGLAVPELCLCDGGLFGDLAAALSRKKFDLHDPEKHRLSASSLGRMAARLASVFAAGPAACPWDDVAALLREDDVLRRIRRLLDKEARRDADGKARASADDVDAADAADVADDADDVDVADDADAADGTKPHGPSRRSILDGLDLFRNTFFPRMLAKGVDYDPMALKERDRSDVAAFATAARALFGLFDGARDDMRKGKGPDCAAAFVRAALKKVYAGRWPGKDAAAEREFSAAAAALRSVLDRSTDATFAGFEPDGALSAALLRKDLADAVYSLEPDSPSALRTMGWLDLPWSDADRVVLAGFNEGDVPDTVSGHPFLPDPLRAGLGLPSNESRLARDTFLLQDLLDARPAGAVRAGFARTNDAGDIHRPSRLLFLVDEGALAERVELLFGKLPAGVRRAPRRMAPDWRPGLKPVAFPHAGDKEIPEGWLSASAIDAWLGCPFAYLLKVGFDMERTKEKDELGADDFGTLVHETLEQYANEQLDREFRDLPQFSEKSDVEGMAADIAADIRRIFAGVRARRGARPPLKIRLQLDAAEKRLVRFADIQARWAKEGWRIVAKPEFGFRVRPFAGEGGADAWIKGSVDRIDYREDVGYRLIDFKTWDEKSAASGHVLGGGKKQLEHADALGLPRTDETNPRRILSVQLPLYGRCLEQLSPDEIAAEIRNGMEKTGLRRKETLPTPDFSGRIADYCYLVLGKAAAETFGERDAKGNVVKLTKFAGTALDTARAAIRAIRDKLFWPPGPGRSLDYGLGDILLNAPENDLAGSDWLAEQRRRQAAFKAGNAAKAAEGGKDRT